MTTTHRAGDWPVSMIRQGYRSAQERLDFIRGWWEHKRRYQQALTERQMLTAELLTLDLIAAAAEAQKAGALSVDLSVDLAEQVARQLGLYGTGVISVRMNSLGAHATAAAA